MKIKRWLLVAAITSLQEASATRADDRTEENQPVKKQIQTSDQEFRILGGEAETAPGAAPENGGAGPALSLGARGASFRFADSNFVARLHGHLQIDSRTFFGDGGPRVSDSFLVRRARPILEGTVFQDFDFLFTPDFGAGANGSTPALTPQVFDAYLSYRPKPELRFHLGKFKSPVGLEQLQPDDAVLFNERSLATELLPTREFGAQVLGEGFDGPLSYRAGVFNAAGDYRNATGADFGRDIEVAGRLFLQPRKDSTVAAARGAGLGVGGSYGGASTAAALPATTGGARSGYATDGQRQFFAYQPAPVGGNAPAVVADGTHWRLSPQGYDYFGPFGLLGEYVISSQPVRRVGAAPLTSARLEHHAWQITGSWTLTGEAASYSGVNPDHPFHPARGQWGAVQLVARLAQMDLDRAAFPLFSDPRASARSARAGSVGLNWWLNRSARLSASLSHTSFSGGGGRGTSAPVTVTRQAENVLFTRAQLAF